MNVTEANDFYRLLDFLFGPRHPDKAEASITQASVAASRLAERAHRALGTGRRDHDVVAMFERLRPGIPVQPPIAAITYGLAPEVFDGEDVLTAQELWAAIRGQFDPNDAWEIEEICPLLRTFLAVLTRRRTENGQLVERLRADLAGARAGIDRLTARPDPAVEPSARDLVDLWDRLNDTERLNLAARMLDACRAAGQPLPTEADTSQGQQEHWIAGGWKGGEGGCGSYCRCGETYAGFDTLGEADALVQAHIDRETKNSNAGDATASADVSSGGSPLLAEAVSRAVARGWRTVSVARLQRLASGETTALPPAGGDDRG